ncbi:hypothetical protein Tco_0930522 [Tanacetum coccineum]
MLAPGNYNPPYKFKWTEKTIPVTEGSSETTTERYMENYKNVLQDIRDQLNVEAKAVQIILTGIDNDICSTVDACPNACEILSEISVMLSSECSVLTSTTTRITKNEVNEIRVERLARTTIPLALLSAEQADWRDDIDDEPDDQELEAHYMYMAQIQELTPDDADNSIPIFDTKPLQKEQEDTNITIDSIDMSTNEETVDQADDDLARERDLLASFIEKLKCEINDSKNRNKFLESSNKALVNKL